MKSMKSMKSMSINQFGDADVFEEISLPMPVVSPGHVLIKVMATSVNPLDYKMRKGVLPDWVSSFPMTLHGDVAGIVEEAGEGVHDFSVGDEIYGCAGGLLNMGGALAEYMLVDAQLIAHKPKILSMAEAASLPLVSLTAWEGLITQVNLQKGQTVLIHGGTGGVGHIAIQLAKYLGAKVFATSSSMGKMELSKKLGADVAINYKTETVQSYLAQHTNDRGFDVVFDTVGGENLTDCFNAAALFGKVVSILAFGSFDLAPVFLKGLSIHMVLQPLPLITGVRRSDYQKILTEVASLVDRKIICPLIDHKKFKIHQVAEAHAYLESGAAIGKVVMTL